MRLLWKAFFRLSTISLMDSPPGDKRKASGHFLRRLRVFLCLQQGWNPTTQVLHIRDWSRLSLGILPAVLFVACHALSVFSDQTTLVGTLQCYLLTWLVIFRSLWTVTPSITIELALWIFGNGGGSTRDRAVFLVITISMVLAALSLKLFLLASFASSCWQRWVLLAGTIR